MSAILLIPPSAEPWSVADAKAFLRVEHGDDDAIITALIAAARARRIAMRQSILDEVLGNTNRLKSAISAFKPMFAPEHG